MAKKKAAKLDENSRSQGQATDAESMLNGVGAGDHTIEGESCDTSCVPETSQSISNTLGSEDTLTHPQDMEDEVEQDRAKDIRGDSKAGRSKNQEKEQEKQHVHKNPEELLKDKAKDVRGDSKAAGDKLVPEDGLDMGLQQGELNVAGTAGRRHRRSKSIGDGTSLSSRENDEEQSGMGNKLVGGKPPEESKKGIREC
ncbi:hypothetical protein M9H77_16950 [Catharanthus roseus]|uniref:Uncharacterized protein n=1 Tax=Catharanthus roseus TaxID=4058 RepID=A0ACC0B375_CATRO|nr:hypothetical protein M9H77_16950 [Catharanthus roseus]